MVHILGTPKLALAGVASTIPRRAVRAAPGAARRSICRRGAHSCQTRLPVTFAAPETTFAPSVHAREHARGPVRVAPASPRSGRASLVLDTERLATGADSSARRQSYCRVHVTGPPGREPERSARRRRVPIAAWSRLKPGRWTGARRPHSRRRASAAPFRDSHKGTMTPRAHLTDAPRQAPALPLFAVRIREP